MLFKICTFFFSFLCLLEFVIYVVMFVGFVMVLDLI